MRYTFKTEKLRIAGNLKNAERYSLEPSNERMRTDPRFRENHRELWMSHKDFIMGYKDKEIVPLKNATKVVHDPYIGGKEKVLKMTERDRDKSKDVSDLLYCSGYNKNSFQFSNLYSKMINDGVPLADVSSFVKQRRSLNLSKSLPKLVPDHDQNQTIREMLVDFDRKAIHSLALKSKLAGSITDRPKVGNINDKICIENTPYVKI